MNKRIKYKKVSTQSSPPSTWTDLEKQYGQSRPISNRIEYTRAIRVVELLSVMDRLNKDQADYFISLSIHIENYEKALVSRTCEDPLNILKFLLRENNMSCSDLGRILGQRELGAKILNRKRNLSLQHIRKLCAHFDVGPQLFIGT